MRGEIDGEMKTERAGERLWGKSRRNLTNFFSAAPGGTSSRFFVAPGMEMGVTKLLFYLKDTMALYSD